MGLAVVAAAILLIVAAVVLFLSDLETSRTRAFDRMYEANRKARTKHR
jgi:archaellum component FlaF (FlaF/FlaG flagellin family)